MMNQSRGGASGRDVLTVMDFVLAAVENRANPEFVAFLDEIAKMVSECEEAIAKAGKAGEIEKLHAEATDAVVRTKRGLEDAQTAAGARPDEKEPSVMPHRVRDQVNRARNRTMLALHSSDHAQIFRGHEPQQLEGGELIQVCAAWMTLFGWQALKASVRRHRSGRIAWASIHPQCRPRVVSGTGVWG